MGKKILLISFIFMTILAFFLSCRRASEEKTSDSPPSQSGVSYRAGSRNEFVPERLRGRRGRRWQLLESSSIRLSDREKEAITIETGRVSYRQITTSLKANGKIIPPTKQVSVISYAFPARVSQILVKPGDWVNEGSPLIVLQSEEVGKSRMEYLRAFSDLELAQANYERQKRLFERGAGAQKDYLAAEAELRVAKATLEACEKKLHLLGFSEEDIKKITTSHSINPTITLYSPVKGRIIEIKVVPGEMVDQTKDMLVILDPRILWVDAEIFEKDIARVKLGQKVEITVPAYPEKIFTGKVIYIGDVLKEETRTITVRTEVDNPGLLLKPGMFATLKINLNGERPVLAIPEAAVCDQDGEKFVFVPRGEDFELRKVVVGSRQDGFYEVISGLKEGEVVVTTGSFQLKSKLLAELLKEAVHD